MAESSVPSVGEASFDQPARWWNLRRRFRAACDVALAAQRLRFEELAVYVREDARPSYEELVDKIAPRVARARVWVDWLQQGFRGFAMFALFLLPLACSIAVGLSADDNWSWWKWILYVVLALPASVVGVLVGFKLQHWGRFGAATLVVGVLVAGAVAVEVIAGGSTSVPVAVVGAVAASTVGAAAAIGFVLLVALVGQRLLLRYQAEPAEALIVYRLAALRNAIDVSWDADSVGKLVEEIEVIAAAIEGAFRRSVHPADAATADWLDTLVRRVAAGVRGWKRQVISPAATSRELLRLQIGNAATNVALRRWEQMLQGEPPVRHAPTRGARFRWVLVGIVRAGIPALAFVALQLSPLALEGGLEIYVGVSVALWALVSLLAAVDPQFAAKIDALQNLASSWPSGDRKV